MPRAYCYIRAEPGYRRESFEKGLQACGYEVHGPCRQTPDPSDCLVIWNRYAHFHGAALNFERAGCPVIVAENGTLGRQWLNDHWYSIALTNPAGAGFFPDGGPSRWESFGVPLCEWRKDGSEAIVLGQRGIGPPGVAMSPGWDTAVYEALRGAGERVRFRPHPGERPAKDLAHDLVDAKYVVTWSSGAACRAMLWGIPVFYGLKSWIGAEASTPWAQLQAQLPRLPDPVDFQRARAMMFEKLGWMIWRTREIETGEPFRRLLALHFSSSRTTPAAH